MCFVWHEYLILLWSLYERRMPSEEAWCYRASNYVHKWCIAISILNYHMYMYTLQLVKFVLRCSICACGHLCFYFWFYIIVPLLWGDQLLVLFLWAWYTSWTRSWNVWLFASSSSSPMLTVYNQSLASIGTRPSHMEEGLVPIPVSDWLCTVLDYSNRMHILHNYFLLHFRASSFKTNHLHEIMRAQIFVPTKCLVCHYCIQVSPFKGS